jgi:pyruvyltransferase
MDVNHLSDEHKARIKHARVGSLAPATGPIPMFWWDAAGKSLDPVEGGREFRSGNFGDIASMEIVQKTAGYPVRQALPGERKLLAIGSVLHRAYTGDIIWGTGLKGSKAAFEKPVKSLSVYAVRGPLTLEFLRREKIDISGVRELFDPGCLMPLLFKQEIEAMKNKPGGHKGGVRIIPHFRDDLALRRQYYRHAKDFVSVDTTPLGMIAALLGADRVVSSSLHGLIFAESLGIPAVWLAPSQEDEMKYYDWYYGTGRFRVTRCTDLEEALRRDPMPIVRPRMRDFLATFPAEEIGAMLGPRLEFGANVDLSNLDT